MQKHRATAQATNDNEYTGDNDMFNTEESKLIGAFVGGMVTFSGGFFAIISALA